MIGFTFLLFLAAIALLPAGILLLTYGVSSVIQRFKVPTEELDEEYERWASSSYCVQHGAEATEDLIFDRLIEQGFTKANINKAFNAVYSQELEEV